MWYKLQHIDLLSDGRSRLEVHSTNGTVCHCSSRFQNKLEKAPANHQLMG